MAVTRMFAIAAAIAFVHLPANAAEWRSLSEQRAFELELGGRFQEAQSAFALSCLEAAKEAAVRHRRGEPAEAILAWAEVMAANAWQLRYYTGRMIELERPFAAARSAVEDLDAPSAAEFAATMTHRLMSIRLAQGNAKQARAESASLGYLVDWTVIGPFEGGDDVHPPEVEIALDARYPGKTREVGWRKAPVAPVDGVVDLDALFRPNDEAAAYAMTHVKSPRGRPVTLRLSTDDGYAIWLNGRKLAARRVERACVFDQDLIDAELAEGWNRILVKVVDAKLDWEFSLRVTGRDGRALALESDSAIPGEAVARDAGGMFPYRSGGATLYYENRLAGINPCADGRFVEIVGTPDPRLIEPNALRNRSLLAAIFKERSSEEWLALAGGALRPIGREEVARAWYALGRLLAAGGAHGVRHHPDRDALGRAVDLDPENPAYLLAYSRVAADWVTMEAERNENPRLVALRRLTDAAPESAAAWYELAAYYLGRQSNPTKALEYASAALELAPESSLAALMEMNALEAIGASEMARVRIEALALARRDDPIVQARWGRELFSSGRTREAMAAFEVAYKADASDRAARRAVAACQLAMGKAYAAVELERGAIDLDPFDSNARVELIRLHEAREDYASALAAIESALEIAPEDNIAHERHGRLLIAMGRGDEARTAFHRSLALVPGNPALERYLNFLDGRTGYDHVFAEDTGELLERAREYVPPEDEPLVGVLEKVMDRVHRDGTSSRTVHRIVTLRNKRGIEAFGAPHVVFWPGEQDVTIKTARVHRADGSTEDAPLDSGRTVSAGYGGVSARMIDLPPLAPGDTVEIEHRVDDLRQSFFGGYFGQKVDLQGRYPRLRSVYMLIAPKDMELSFKVRGGPLEPAVEDWAEEDAVVRTWRIEPAESFRPEPLMPPDDELGAQVQVSTYRDWTGFGRWYWNLVRDQHAANDAIASKVRELTAGLRTETERILAIYEFVTGEIQYSAWPFGVHGFKPYRATKVFEQRFGDCKDTATLMKVMLELVGVESYPALVFSTIRRPREDLELPLFSHFNHMIVYVPPGEDRPELWLDGTATLNEMETIPISDAGALACVIYPDGGRIKRIPDGAPEDNSLVERMRFEIDRRGESLSARLITESRARGWQANFARVRLGEDRSAKRILEHIYGRQFPSYSVERLNASRLDDIAEPVRYETLARLAKLGSRRGDDGLGWTLPLPRSMFRGIMQGDWAVLAPEHYSDCAPLSRRRHDVVMSVPWKYRNRTTYVLPDGLEFRAPPGDVRLEEPFGSFSLTFSLDGRELTATKEVTLKARRIGSGEYEAFRSFVNRADRAERIEIGVRLAD